MNNGEIVYTYNLELLRVLKMCILEDHGMYVSAVEIYGTTTHNVHAFPRCDCFSTPEEALQAMKECSETLIDAYFEEDYKQQESEAGE